MVAIKPLFPVWIVAFLFLFFTHLSYRVILPLRYPPDGVDEKGKDGDGIMYVGHMRSTNPYENFREVWMADSDLRTHFLILGSTGSGKSETLKGMFYNALCWGSGFFLADGKADNKMPLDLMAMCRMLGADDDFLALNFLIGGSSPEKIRASRRRRTNMINTFSDSDADTQIQMGANLLPKAEGDGKSWQEKALNFWRSLVAALCYKRDTQGFEISVGAYIDYMGLPKVEELYAEGYREYIEKGEWSYGFVGIKSYCESGGCPGFMVDRVIAKYNLPPDPNSASRTGLPTDRGLGGRGAPASAAGKPAQKTEQDQATYDQHGYRIGQLMPALNLLDKTYGHIFRAKYSEIDMVDVALNNRVLVMMIPSLEKSASEAENLGKLAIACLRVMMGRNLGADIEGDRSMVLDSKATEANYPFLVALDELGYYFSDGIAVMFAQARSLGMSMIAAAQDIEKLTEGSRASEAGAMLANAVAKYFMRIDDAQKTQKLISDYVGKARVAVYNQYALNAGGFRRDMSVSVETVERVTIDDMQSMKTGQGLINTRGKTFGIAGFYVGNYLDKYKMKTFRLNRFLQVRPVSMAEVEANAIKADALEDKVSKGLKLIDMLTYKTSPNLQVEDDMLIGRVSMVAQGLPASITGAERGAALYVAARRAAEDLGLIKGAATGADAGSLSGGDRPLTDAAVGNTAQPGAGAAAATAGGDPEESVGLPSSGEFASFTRPGGAPASADAAVEAGAPALTPEVSDDPFAYLDDAIFERMPVEAVTSPTRRAPPAFPVSPAKAAAPAPAPTSPPAAAQPGAIDVDAFIDGALGGGAAAPARPLVAPTTAPSDPAALFADLDGEGGVSAATDAAQAPAGEPLVAASDIFAPDILSTAVKATIAALLSTGEVVYEQNSRGASGKSAVPTDNAAAPAVVPKATASATLGQNPGWVTNALAGAETTLKKVGPDAIGFNDRTRELVVSVEAALGGPDPVAAAQITERIVAAQVTPVEDDEVPDGKEQSVDDFLASLGGSM
ncbi:type IV secretion system DNA-binding domain-containing protein [Variovorax ginsengisoli]|uniref:Type IV secretion system DNA-binding domain-containing protein n=1 Tax=Variovorax ginsengisoli TaxID=363844 RepID=A0ABT8S9S7_9BURK|nr:type IV secretion system DNA-binding domain-containing protein [Variovorax ginsengisoli]MDN8616491.1 type IV secretion system DNA-binding domain-containing protein [Variovorax ginsengisoli]MDO1535661.1 type IV secretion system DNA-binding domain-containing protein [Variovorax ginsengisoli]